MIRRGSHLARWDCSVNIQAWLTLGISRKVTALCVNVPLRQQIDETRSNRWAATLLNIMERNTSTRPKKLRRPIAAARSSGIVDARHLPLSIRIPTSVNITNRWANSAIYAATKSEMRSSVSSSTDFSLFDFDLEPLTKPVLAERAT
jgi:hypothetical protein